MTRDTAALGNAPSGSALPARTLGGAPATLLRRIVLQGRYETVTMLRNGEQLILAIVLPLLAMVGLTVTPLLDGFGASRINVAVPGILALCAMSTAFTGQGISTGFDRRYGVLRFLSTTPLGRTGLIAGKVLAVLAVLSLQVLVVTAVALVLGWRHRMDFEPTTRRVMGPVLWAFTLANVLLSFAVLLVTITGRVLWGRVWWSSAWPWASTRHGPWLPSAWGPSRWPPPFEKCSRPPSPAPRRAVRDSAPPCSP